jgi:hypothetical protein
MHSGLLGVHAGEVVPGETGEGRSRRKPGIPRIMTSASIS